MRAEDQDDTPAPAGTKGGGDAADAALVHLKPKVSTPALRGDGSASGSEPSVRGLTSGQARKLLAEHGPNTLPEARQQGPLEIFARQFLSPFIYILIVAAAVSFLVGQTPSGVFIIAVLLLNAVIGAVQEVSAQRSANALKAMVRGQAHVIRDGTARVVDIEELVPGDVVLVGSGDRVPADITLATSDNLDVDESMLTGESLAVTKRAGGNTAADAPLADRDGALFAGSIVTRGRGMGTVAATGAHTSIGDIALRVGAERQSEPPLMVRIRRFTFQIAGAIFVAIIALAAAMALRGGYDGVAIIMMGVGLAVSTIPEGLPAALTVALAIGMRRMAKANVIIRKLVAVEALGSCTFICSDKTGTLTVNELTIARALLPSGRVFETTGAGVGPGAVHGDALESLKTLCVTGALANESRLDYAGGEWVSDGDIVDVAFLVLAKKLGLSINALRAENPRLALIPYESERAFSGSVNALDGADAHLSVKGGPEKILAASETMQLEDRVVPIDRDLIEGQFESLASQGYRVIALARRPARDQEARSGLQDDEALSGLTFLGLVAMIDPVRPEAAEAIAKCRDGGIEVAMVTGDHPATARAIGAQLGLCTPDAQVVTGAMIRDVQLQGAEAARRLITPARVFARIEPAQKELIVETFMQEGHFVAVTGDGVNDAPAMRRANAGVAMGKSGTDVAKEAADLIITDDNFASIVAGVEQGRIVYNNIRKVIGLLTATGFSAIVLFFLSVAVGLPMPMTAVQLLWLNLVANGLQDVALAFEPKEGNELAKPPRRPSEPIIERHILEHILVVGGLMGVLAFAVYAFSMNQFAITIADPAAAHAAAQNVTLMLMVLFGNMHALQSRSETQSVFTIPYAANPFLACAVPAALLIHLVAQRTPGLSDVLGLAPVPFETFVQLVTVALIFLIAEELHKASWRLRAGVVTRVVKKGAA